MCYATARLVKKSGFFKTTIDAECNVTFAWDAKSNNRRKCQATCTVMIQRRCKTMDIQAADHIPWIFTRELYFLFGNRTDIN